MNPVILLEFNELSPVLMDRFITAGHLPNFQRFRDESRTFITQAEEQEPFLEPWIQWVTVHTGVNYKQHGIYHLDEGHKLTLPRVWDVLDAAGHRSWICGSMNAAARTSATSLLPDPWSTKVPASPRELDAYVSFVSRQVLEHTNDNVPLSGRDYARFATFMATHGLSPRTVIATMRQLAAERRNGDCRWQRVVLLDLMQYDVFAHYHRRLKPGFSTFFLNSTAHYQHAYWESMEPDVFGHPLPVEGDTHRDAILFGYKQMDRLIGEMFKRFDGQATLVLATAMSQEPWTSHKDDTGGAFYRPKDIAKFVELAGVTGPFTAAPVMSEQFNVDLPDAAAAQAAERMLATLRIDGKRLLMIQRNGSRLFAGCGLRGDVDAQAMVSSGDRTWLFSDMFYKVPTGKCAKHHPDGLLWFRMADRRHRDGGSTPLASVAPTILSMFGVAPPRHMEEVPLSLAAGAPLRKTA